MSASPRTRHLPDPPGPMRTRWRAVLALGLIGAGAAVVLWRSFDAGTDRADRPIATERLAVEVPAVDARLLDQVRDGTPAERLRIEPRPLEHLLRLAPDLTPEVLAAMGLAEDGQLTAVRREPARWRGRPVSVRGTLASLAPLPEPHPQPGRSVWSGQVRSADGQAVLFKVVEPPDDIAIGSPVLIAGLFFKLHDGELPATVASAPLLVGQTVVPTWPDWAPVDALDPAVLARARDEDLAEQQRVQRLPLYHLTDWVRRHPQAASQARPLGQAEWVRLMEGAPDQPRGTGFEIHGRIARVEELTAEDNPLGIQQWSRVWLWQPELRATLCVLVPRALPVHHQEDLVTVTGWFLKRFAHQPRQGSALVTTCLFLADTLPGGAGAGDSRWVRYTSLSLLILVSLLMTFLLLSPGSTRRRAADSLVERLMRHHDGGAS